MGNVRGFCDRTHLQDEKMLQNVLQSGPTLAVEAAQAETGVEGGQAEQPESEPSFTTYESIDKMQEDILNRCTSEVAGVEIIKGKNGGLYLLSEKKRILPRHTLIGVATEPESAMVAECFWMFLVISCYFFEFNTPKFHHSWPRYVPWDPNMDDAEKGKHVNLHWDQGDRTIMQVDMSSLQPESTAYETMTAYKYFLLLEKHKRVTTYDVSYSTCVRKPGGSGPDGFELGPKDPHCYKTQVDLTKTLTCKTIFWDSAFKIEQSKGLISVFRFRFDRVHAVTKVQKPYVFTAVALQLEAGQPILLT